MPDEESEDIKTPGVPRPGFGWTLVAALPFVAGCGFCGFGVYLFVLGVRGESDLLVDWDGFKFQLLNAAPGLILAALGAFIVGLAIWKGPPRVEVRETTRTIRKNADGSVEETEKTKFGQLHSFAALPILFGTTVNLYSPMWIAFVLSLVAAIMLLTYMWSSRRGLVDG